MSSKLCRLIVALSLLESGGPVIWAQTDLTRIVPSDQEASRYGLVREWVGFVPVDGTRERVMTMTLAGDRVTVQTDASRLHMLDAETGELMWTAQIGVPRPNPYGNALNSKSIYAISGTTLYRVSSESGAILKSLPLPSIPSTAPAADEEYVIVPLFNGQIHIYKADSLEEQWNYQANDAVISPGIFVQDRFACASRGGLLYVFAKSPQTPVIVPQFRYSTGTAVEGSLGKFGEAVLLPVSYELHAVDTRAKLDLQPTLWRYPGGGPIRQPVTVINKDVYLIPDGAGLHCISAETGQRIWVYPKGTGFVAASQNNVYARDRLGRLVILDHKLGRVKKVWDTSQFDMLPRNPATDRIFLAQRSGLVVCLHETGNEEPLQHRPQSDGSAGGGPAGAQSN